MPSIGEIRRMRKRRKNEQRRLGILARTSSALLASLGTLLGVVGLGVAVAYAELQRGLPSVDELQVLFGASGGDFPAPTRFYDRSGDDVVEEMLHPLARERLWVNLASGMGMEVYQDVVHATVAAQDASFWTNPGYYPHEVLPNILAGLEGQDADAGSIPIAQQLAQHLVQPVQDASIHPLERYLRSVLLAARLNDVYSKQQILEWYLNSAYYGNLAYGIDAAALVYFGLHASDLSLAQAALLAPIAQNPELNPVDAPQEARRRQERTLADMLRSGYIDEGEQLLAIDASLGLRGSEDIREGLRTSGFSAYAWQQLQAVMGPQFAHRPGLQVRTSLDLELQLQADCTVQTYLARMSGGNPAQLFQAADGSDCVAAVNLPPLRPGDVGLDHGIRDVSVVILDPFSGEMLSIADTQAAFSTYRPQTLAAQQGRELGSAFFPFIYLTAFSRGLAPGTMVLDLPVEGTSLPGGSASQTAVDWHDYRGPVRMRTALVGSFQSAAARTLELVGEGNVLRIAQQMGISGTNVAGNDSQLMLSQGGASADLIDLTRAFALMANSGSMVGLGRDGLNQDPGEDALEPIAILQIEDASGNIVFSAEAEVRVVLSPQLAYMMSDVLSDEVERWAIYGQSSPLEIGRSAGTVIGTTPEANDNWTIGFTPSRAIGVWVGNVEEGMAGVGQLNGAASLWHALMLHGSRHLPLQGWSMPPGVTEMEVCDPSGLLPTLYCPDVVREVFILGTEPTSYDHLFRPFRVNRETGKLATLFTPLNLVEERVYMIPPPEALEWARHVGIEQPPQEYDSIYVEPAIDPAVNITSVEPFAYVSGELLIEGNAHPEGFVYYRLQYGAGINPTRWVQIDQDIDTQVQDGALGAWNTEGLNGLYTLQLVVVREGNRVDTAAVPLTIDNLPPLVSLADPQPGQQFSMTQEEEVIINAQASDETGLAQVAFYVDGRRIGVLSAAPFTTKWTISAVGEHALTVRAYDLAGNSTQSDSVTIRVVP